MNFHDYSRQPMNPNRDWVKGSHSSQCRHLQRTVVHYLDDGTKKEVTVHSKQRLIARGGTAMDSKYVNVPGVGGIRKRGGM